MIKRMFM